MKKQTEKLLGDSLLVVWYGSLIGIGVWRALRPKPVRDGWTRPAEAGSGPLPQMPNAADHEVARPAARAKEKPASLSLSTPGDAPLDRLSREATRETRQERLTGDRPEFATPKTPVAAVSARPETDESASVTDLLQRQELESGQLPGWNQPRPDKLPVPTFAPAVMALGIVIFAMGLATIWYVCVVGSLVFAVAAWRWVGELQGE